MPNGYEVKLLEKIRIEPYLDDIELVVVGGESDKFARTFDYNHCCGNGRMPF